MIAVAAASLGVDVEPLDERIDVPVNCWNELQHQPPSVLHAHYHALLGAPLPQPNPLLDGSVPLADDVASWLRGRVPLRTGAKRT